jgi:hypothetical protein
MLDISVLPAGEGMSDGKALSQTSEEILFRIHVCDLPQKYEALQHEFESKCGSDLALALKLMVLQTYPASLYSKMDIWSRDHLILFYTR